MQKERTISQYLLILMTVSSLTACGQNTASNQTVPSSGTSASVETKAPNSDYKPAFTGQTRIGSVKTTTPYEAKVVTEALKSPWGITSLPDGRLLVTEREGTMRLVTQAGQVSDPITGMPSVNAGGAGWLAGRSGRSGFCH